MRRQGGFTLTELLIAVALVGVLIALAAPAMTDMIRMQRLRNTNAQVVTDMQFGRAEAVARRDFMRVFFKSDATQTCYSIYTSPDNATRCDCLLGAGAACSGAMVEVKTANFPRSAGVFVAPPAGQLASFAFDWRTGGIYAIPTDNVPRPISLFGIQSYIDDPRKLVTRLNQAGRPTVCTPAGSTTGEPVCP